MQVPDFRRILPTCAGVMSPHSGAKLAILGLYAPLKNIKILNFVVVLYCVNFF